MTARAVAPLTAPLDAVVELPGSKSITNRALVCAALARQPSTITGALVADDTDAMCTCLRQLGTRIVVDGTTLNVTRRRWTDAATLDARLSGTTARFLLPVVATAAGRYRIDGAPPLRARPMGPVLDALRALGATVTGDHLPVEVRGPVLGGTVAITGDTSSQFLSGLLLAGAVMPRGLTVELTTPLVSKPYVELTRSVMEAFGARVDGLHVPFSGYSGRTYAVEPDASAASYFFAAATITGGRVRVEGLGRDSMQGDVAFVRILERMGARVTWEETAITVEGTGTLRGIDADLSDLSDTAQTLAVVAAFADSPVGLTGIGFIRGKETDRIGNTVRELQRAGIHAEERPDGFVVHPGSPQPARIETYDDHRMAMSFAVLGLAAPGIEIADPDCVGKTFPGFWSTLDSLRS
ncbi:MAG TPA: 3-phosphoshikimate 1-carboxyvinyltransferase [Acidimicrobiales bacterium]|nr:3-phosphoshikimate 1-carboxyvinyltransferase [Acidimicrobiales bacterium]